MSLTISEHTEARLAEEARREGLSVDALPGEAHQRAYQHFAAAPSTGIAFVAWWRDRFPALGGGISTAMSLEPGILDANVLIYAVVPEAPQHPASRALLDAVRDDPGVTFYVTSQILCEFYSVVTNPRRMTVARSSAEAIAAIEGF